ncbi:hypothetical protein FIE12Z_8852 [Fusarium flagelliforme]|uniref:Chitin-binding type-1 domain-containing protein n=1 Tax=Fusarium flagelliforme TaxID=2675880 RepID=A0A395MID7_9HYPO|nr:hypothetical protein FIE12Z_8852 [Fusarium flagelliforme]
MELSLLYFLCLFSSALASRFGFEFSNSLILPRSNNPTSKDGNCGSNSDTNATCLTSTFGNCCSEKGFCGKTSAYCAEGCQEDFGTCSATDGQLGAHLETVAPQKGTAVIMKPTVVMVTLSTTTAADETSTLAASSTDDDASSADSTSTSEPTSATEGQSDSSSSDSLSTGAKAGIAIGAVIGGLGAIGLIAWLVLRRRNKNNTKPAESVAESNEVKPADELRYELHGETRAELPAYEVQR